MFFVFSSAFALVLLSSLTVLYAAAFLPEVFAAGSSPTLPSLAIGRRGPPVTGRSPSLLDDSSRPSVAPPAPCSLASDLNQESLRAPPGKFSVFSELPSLFLKLLVTVSSLLQERIAPNLEVALPGEAPVLSTGSVRLLPSAASARAAQSAS